MILHAGLIAIRIGGPWRGVLITGPSGAGKSDLALRLLQRGFRLVTDDRTVMFRSGAGLYGAPPASLRGLLEVRAVGIGRHSFVPLAEIVLAVHCVASPGAVERLPPLDEATFLDQVVPQLALWPFEPSAAEKIIVTLERLGSGRKDGYHTPHP